MRDMEDEKGAFIHDRESKSQHISVGNVDTRYNGHKRRVEPT
jgi:hypothetical protein